MTSNFKNKNSCYFTFLQCFPLSCSVWAITEPADTGSVENIREPRITKKQRQVLQLHQQGRDEFTSSSDGNLILK